MLTKKKEIQKKKDRITLPFKAAIVLFAVLSIVIIITIQVKLSDMKKKVAELEAAASEYSEQLGLLEYLNEMPEEEYIERYAREVLGYHKDGEIVFRDDAD